MSFSNNVKNEICNIKPQNNNQLYAKAYGMLSFSKNFSVSDISLHTTNKEIADLYAKMIYTLVKIETSVTTREYIKDDKKTYVVSVDTLDDRIKVLSFFGHNKSAIKVHLGQIKSDEELKFFLSGVFLVCGNISNPQKSYHLEFVCPSTQHKKLIESLVSPIGIDLPTVTRRKSIILYTKDSQQIEDILAYMGAVKSIFSLMNVKIYKDIRNNVNRVTNCETANIEKTVNASSVQINDIRYLKEIGKLDELPQNLIELANIRLENPDLSLREIAELLGGGITKSGVNHRFAKISKIANEYRETNILKS